VDQLLLIDLAFRRMGVGSQLFDRALDAMAGYRVVCLDATPAGQGLHVVRALAHVRDDQLLVWHAREVGTRFEQRPRVPPWPDPGRCSAFCRSFRQKDRRFAPLLPHLPDVVAAIGVPAGADTGSSTTPCARHSRLSSRCRG